MIQLWLASVCVCVCVCEAASLTTLHTIKVTQHGIGDRVLTSILIKWLIVMSLKSLADALCWDKLFSQLLGAFVLKLQFLPIFACRILLTCACEYIWACPECRAYKKPIKTWQRFLRKWPYLESRLIYRKSRMLLCWLLPHCWILDSERVEEFSITAALTSDSSKIMLILISYCFYSNTETCVIDGPKLN